MTILHSIAQRILGSLALAILPAAVHAGPVEQVPIGGAHLNVEQDELLGSGSQVSYLVVDFRAAGGGSFAFSYRHDGRQTAAEMLSALDAADVLDVSLEDFSFGPAVRGIAYPREGQEDVFAGAFSGPRSWVLWDGTYDGRRVNWNTSNVGINGVEFGNTEPTIFLASGGFLGLSTSSEFPGPEPLVPLTGDFNSDGVVDGDDLISALLSFGTDGGPTLAAGDADRDGDVDRADITLWSASAGARIPPPIEPAAIPEPAAVAVACLSLWSAVACRRCRERSP
jgi:hypothetical protein